MSADRETFTEPARDRRHSLALAPAYRSALRWGIGFQAVGSVLTSLLLDHGRQAQLFLAALVGHWVGIGLIMWRRPQSPSKWDLLFVRYGILLLWGFAALVALLLRK